MATIQCTVQRSSWYEVYFEYSYTQDKSKATTTLSHSLKLKQLTDGYDFDTVGSVTVGYSVSGKTFSNTGRINIDDKGNKGYTITLASGSSTITHNQSTGEGSFTVSVDTSIDSAGYGPGTIKLASKTVTLPTIYRASKPTVSASTVKMGNTLTIYTNRKSSSFTHTLSVTMGGGTGTIQTSVGDSYNWTVWDLASRCNNATSGKATITCTTYNGSTIIGTETCEVTITVPNATTPVFTNGNVIIGTSNPIATNAGSANFSHTITYSFNGKTGNVNAEKVKSGIVWWTPSNLASAITSDTGKGSITCTTYNGTAVVGTKTIEFTGVVPNTETFQPTLSIFSISPSGSLPAAFSGLYIQGKTGVRASFTASSTYSTIASYKLTADGKNFFGNPATSDAFTRDGNFTVTGIVTDKRGFHKSKSMDVTVIPYSKPTIEPSEGYSSIICERSLQDGTYDDAGIFLHIKCKLNYAPLVIDSLQRNSCFVTYQTKVGDGAFGNEEELFFSGDSTQVDNDVVLPNVVSQTDKSYTIKIIVRDSIGSEEPYYFSIPTADVTMHLGKGGYGVAVGKYSEATADKKMFEVAEDWDVVVYGDRWKSLGVSTSVPASSENNLGRVGSGNCCYIVENGNHVYVAFTCGLKWENAVVKVNNVSIPSEYRPKNTVYSFCVCDGRYIAKVGITKAGDVYIASCQDASEGTDTSSVTVGWVDGYVDYFI